MSKNAFSFIAIMMLIASRAMAEPRQLGNWFFETEEGKTPYAATINDSGALFGQYCSLALGSCLWLLGIATTCENGHEYPVLANSDIGAKPLKILCDSQLENGLYRYIFTEFDLIDDIAKRGALVGFAIPLQTDQFRVIRFDLSGSAAAIAAMKANVRNRVAPSQPKPNTKDTRDKLL